MAAPRKRKLDPNSAFVVTAGCVVAKDAAGAHGYFYEGAVLPETVPLEEKERLVDTGLVAVVEPWTPASATSPDGEQQPSPSA